MASTPSENASRRLVGSRRPDLDVLLVRLFTVGYGDTCPHTFAGKAAAIVLMVVGIAFFGWATAALASIFVETSEEVDEKQARAALQERMDAIDARLERIERHLAHEGDEA